MIVGLANVLTASTNTTVSNTRERWFGTLIDERVVHVGPTGGESASMSQLGRDAPCLVQEADLPPHPALCLLPSSSSSPSGRSLMPPPSSAMSMRSLTLHISALNDSEYDYFTASFSDLLDDPDAVPGDESKYDSATVSIREARAWLRGRYNAVPVADLDAILRTISPNHAPLTAGQFFAAMRLITHVSAGKEIDGSLVFVQCEFSLVVFFLPACSLSCCPHSFVFHRFPFRHVVMCCFSSCFRRASPLRVAHAIFCLLSAAHLAVLR